MNEMARVCWGHLCCFSVADMLMAAIFIDWVSRLLLPLLDEAGAEPKQS
jgi:hypothetical protein